MYTLVRQQLRLKILEKELVELKNNKAYYIAHLEKILQPVYKSDADVLKQNIQVEYDKLVQETEQKIKELRKAVEGNKHDI